VRPPNADTRHANGAGHNVTELSASTGVRVISGSQYDFDGTLSVSSDGTHVWGSSTKTATASPSSTPPAGR
jgi:hypothetical protein